MNYKLGDLIDIPLLQNLQDQLNVIYSFPSAIVDNDGKILTAVAWQDVCTKFHRKNPECEKECIKSDRYIFDHLHEANPAVSYQCPHGMIDNAAPIIIDGKHLGNFFTGQFFFEKPDLDFFKEQAKKYGFDEKAYLEAVEKVPVWTKEKLTHYLDFIKGFIEIIAGLGLKNLKEIEINKVLKEKEERSLLITQSTADWIWEIDENEKYSYCSEKVEKILGYKVSELLGKSPFDLMPEVEVGSIKNIYQELRKTNSPIVDLENWNFHKDGHLVCLLTNGFPKYDRAGKFIGYIGADKDITERKKVEEELLKAKEKAEESEVRFKNLANQLIKAQKVSKVGSWQWYIKEDRLVWSPEMYSIFGISEDTFTGKLSDVLQKAIHPDDRAKVDASNASASEKGVPVPVEYRIVLPDGTIKMVWAEAGELVKDENSVPILLTGIVQDITERKKEESELIHAKERAEEGEKALKHSHDLMQYIIEHNRSAVAVHDKNFKYLYVSKRYLQDYKLKEKDILGRHHYDVFPDLPQKWKDIHKKALAGEASSAEDDAYYKEDGTVEWTRWECRPWYEKENTIGGFIIYTEVITERKNMELEFKAAKEKAEESNRLKTEFLNNMSHEIRTPMNGIIGFSEMLDKPDISDEKRKYFAKIVQNSSQQLLRIIDDILEISTLETKQNKLKEEQLCLNDLIMEQFTVFNLKSKERNIPLYIKKGLHDNESHIISDKSKLIKIIGNLLENSLKFTNEGFIELGYDVKMNNIVLYVKDTGIGIAPKNHKLIFERFSQEDKDISQNHGGLGLGLSISQENARLLGGDISLHSEKGKGSTFYVTFPYKPVKKINEITPTAIISSKKESYTILVAEDEEVNYLYIEALLEAETEICFNIIHAKNGKEAVELCLDNKKIDIVLMDIKMPIMNGHEATEEIKKKLPNLPIVAQTAYSTESDKELALKHGCNDFISKPINKEKLSQIISKYIQKN